MRLPLLAVSFCLIAISGWLSLTVASSAEPVYNIVYIHVPAAIASLACFTALFVCSVGYLKTNRHSWDTVAAASAQVGLVFATAMNATGMIFAHATWQTWWTPSLRLISSAMLWFLYVAYVILRSALAAEQRREQLCAVFGIIAFVDVPLVFISARFVRDIHRPGVTFESPWQSVAFGLAVLGALLLAAALIRLRAEIANAESRISSAAASGAD